MLNIHEYIKDKLSSRFFVANQKIELTVLQLKQMLQEVYELGKSHHHEKSDPIKPFHLPGDGRPPGQNESGPPPR
jgi:hypothetical protein